MDAEEAKELQEHINETELKELAHWYGGWDELKKVIQKLEDNDNEAASERYYSKRSKRPAKKRK